MFLIQIAVWFYHIFPMVRASPQDIVEEHFSQNCPSCCRLMPAAMRHGAERGKQGKCEGMRKCNYYFSLWWQCLRFPFSVVTITLSSCRFVCQVFLNGGIGLSQFSIQPGMLRFSWRKLSNQHVDMFCSERHSSGVPQGKPCLTPQPVKVPVSFLGTLAKTVVLVK